MKIRYQLFLIFLILGVSVTLTISVLVFYQWKRIIMEQVFSHLESVSETKKMRLEEMINRKTETMKLVTSNPILSENIQKLQKQGKFSHRKEIDSVIRHYTEILSYFSKISIVNLDGKVIASSKKDQINRDLSIDKGFQKTLARGKYLDHFFYNKEKELILTGGVFINNPVTQEPDGVLLVEMSAEDFIDLTSDYTGLGKTGETVLAKQNDQTAFLLSTRFNPTGLNINLPAKNDKYVINMALRGEQGIKEGLDYRNKEVIASLRFLEEKKWGIVTKIDKEEVSFPIQLLRNFLIALNIGFIVVAFAASFIIGRFLAKPVEELNNSINRIRQGDLSSRVHVRYKNELGILASSFNEMADRLESKINEMDKVGHVLSHDLRAPLNSILPLVDFIKEENGAQLNEEGHKMLDMIKSRSIQMNELIHEILQSARTEKRIKENIDVDALVGLIVANLNPPDHIQISIQHNLPVLYFHRVSLMQVFQNLIQNAIKFMDKEKGIINIGFTEEKEHYKFWVADNGAGITEEKIYKIFNMYETGASGSGSESTGIGLGVVKKIIRENKGEIWVESTPAKGSVFYFTIPKG